MQTFFDLVPRLLLASFILIVLNWITGLALFAYLAILCIVPAAITFVVGIIYQIIEPIFRKRG